MGKYGLNYLYLSKKHAGGKDQVGFNLLKGFHEAGIGKKLIIFCFDYSTVEIKNICPESFIYEFPSSKCDTELMRLLVQLYYNTIIIPKLAQKFELSIIFQLAINNGLRKLPVKTVLLPHDIKQISNRKIGESKLPFYKYILYKIIYALDFKHADRIIAISECDKEDMFKYYPKYKSKIRKIYNPIDVKEFENDSRMIEEPYILAINIQFLHKNIITLLKSYRKLCGKINQKLVLVGSIPKRVEFLKEYVIENHMDDRVIFTGFVTEEEMYRWLINADLYVNPTLFEGFGMTAVEAMWRKVPCLLSNIPVNIEVTQGEAKYYGPADDVDALAESIIACLQQKIQMEESERKSQLMKSRYEYLNIAKEYIMCFDELLDSGDCQ